jgi:hypothetical protein
VRTTGTPGLWQAVFGYVYSGGSGADLALPVATASNWLVSAFTPNQPQTTLFRANAQLPRAFETTFAAADELQWRVCAPNSTCVAAIANRWTPLCDTNATLLREPVQPLATGCVSRVADQCTVTLGYANPNELSIALAPGSADNAFAPAPADRRQPLLFWPGTVLSAFSVTFGCAAQDWTLAWTLAGGGSVVLDARDLC